MIVGLLNRGVLLVATAAREGLTAGRSCPEMAPQRFEKIGPAPGNGTARQPRTHKIWYRGAGLTVRDSG